MTLWGCFNRVLLPDRLIPIGLTSLLLAGLVMPMGSAAAGVSCVHKPVAAADITSDWSIDLLTYASRTKAEGLVYRLKRKQFIAATLERQDHDAAGRPSFQVRMSGFDSRAEAESCRLLLKIRTNIRDQHIHIVPPSQPAVAKIQTEVAQTEVPQADASAVTAQAGLSLLNDYDLSRTMAVSLTESAQLLTENVAGMTLRQVVEFGLSHNVQYREQLSNLSILDLDVAAAADPFSIKSRVSSSSSQRVGTQLGQDYRVNFNKKFLSGSSVGIGFGTARFAGQSLSEATLSLNQPLLRGRGTLVNTIGIENAEKNRIRQGNLIGHHKQQLILDIVTAYYRTILQQKSIGIHRATIEQSQNMLDASTAKFKFGMVSRMDVFRAELQLLEAQESFEAAHSAHEKSLDDLKFLIGSRLDNELVLSDLIRFSAADLLPEQALIEQALSSRYELVNLKIDQQLLLKKIGVAKNNMLPQLDLTLQVSQSGTANTFAQSTRLKDTRVGIGLSGSPDFSMAAEQAQYRRQLLAHDNAGHQYEQMQEKIRSAVKERVRQLRQGEKRISLRQRKVEAAEKQKQYALVRYQKGLVDNTTLVEAEKSMVTAKIGYLQAIVDYNISLYALYKEMNQLNADLLDRIEPQAS